MLPPSRSFGRRSCLSVSGDFCLPKTFRANCELDLGLGEYFSFFEVIPGVAPKSQFFFLNIEALGISLSFNGSLTVPLFSGHVSLSQEGFCSGISFGPLIFLYKYRESNYNLQSLIQPHPFLYIYDVIYIYSSQ